VFSLASPVAGKPIAVLQEPVANGACGRAVVAGMTVVQLDVQNAAHVYCHEVASDTAKLQTDSWGSARILYRAGTSGTQWGVVVLLGGRMTKAVPVTVEITAKTAYNEYTVDVWEGGLKDSAGVARAKDYSGVTLYVTEIDSSDEIPTDVYLDAMYVNGHCECNVPRFL